MLELLSLTSNNDLVLIKIRDYYLCLVEPSKRKYNFNWYEARKYCKSLGEGYSLPSKDELNLIYKLKGDLSLVEACLYSEDINTLDFISKTWLGIHPYHPWVWSSSDSVNEVGGGVAWYKNFNSGNHFRGSKEDQSTWTIPIRRVEC